MTSICWYRKRAPSGNSVTVNIKKGFPQFVYGAEAVIETLSAEEATKLQDCDDVLIVDLRDVRELKREGRAPGSFHMPRCMLDFWIDPESPYFQGVFSQDKRFVFSCNEGWRSALAGTIVGTVYLIGLDGPRAVTR